MGTSYLELPCDMDKLREARKELIRDRPCWLTHPALVDETIPSPVTRRARFDGDTPEMRLRANMEQLANESTGLYLSVPVVARAAEQLAKVAPWAHVRQSTETAHLWAYYRTMEHCLAGRRTKTKPGRVLRFFKDEIMSRINDNSLLPEFTTSDFDVWVAEVSNAWNLTQKKPVLRFATDADTIEEIYTHGPKSCMSGGDWESGIHPARAYASPDIAVAYVAHGGELSNTNIVARAVCNTKNQTYVKAYGNKLAIDQLLDDAGYTTDNDAMCGCRLAYIESANGRIVAPFVDGDPDTAEHISDGNGDSWLLIRDTGDYCLNSTTGYIEEAGVAECADCGFRYPEDDMFFIELTEQHICDCCANANYTWAYDTGGYRGRLEETWVPNYDVAYTDDGGSNYTEAACERSDDIVSVDGVWCTLDDVFFCEDCNEPGMSEDAKLWEDDDGYPTYLCDSCHADKTTAREEREENAECA